MDLFKEYLKYDEHTGFFTWIKSAPPKGKIGNIAGHNSHDGYIRITLKGVNVYAHRLAWFFHNGFEPNGVIDHINGNPSDNRICNLRLVTQKENCYNKKEAGKGVRLTKSGKFEARAGRGGTIGFFETECEAREAYIKEIKRRGFIDKKAEYKFDFLSAYSSPSKENLIDINLSELSRKTGIPQPTLHYRISKMKMSVEDAIKASKSKQRD